VTSGVVEVVVVESEAVGLLVDEEATSSPKHAARRRTVKTMPTPIRMIDETSDDMFKFRL
jgi:hypothetical protein